MITPVKNISFKSINAKQKVNNLKSNSNQPYSTNSLYDNSLKINFGHYLSFHKPVTFEQTVEENFFHLPKVKVGENERQIMPDESQLECAKYLYEGRNVVFDAPTGMGKTAIAHWASAKNIKEGKKTVYTVPIKALANDKFNEFSKIYGEENVGILTGDRKINVNAPITIMTTEIFHNQSQSLTPYQASKIGTVIFDEAHYIGDEERGGAWENSIINAASNGVQILCLSATIGNCDEFTNWINSISGSRQTTRVEVEPKNRPVPLVSYLFKGNDLITITDSEIDLNDDLTDRKKRALEVLYKAEFSKTDDEKLEDEDYDFVYSQLKSAIGDGQNNFKYGIQEFKRKLAHEFRSLNETQVELIAQLMSNPDIQKIKAIHTPWSEDNLPKLVEKLRQEDMLPAIIFKLAQGGCEDAARNLAEGQAKYDEDELSAQQLEELEKQAKEFDLLTQEEKEQVQEIIEKYEKKGVYLGKKLNKDMLLRGWAVHHAGRMPQYKKLVEELFSKKLTKVVISTSTLGAGINMPARTVVMTNTAYKKYNPETKEVEYTPLTANEYHQMRGRAGRRGIDDIGNFVLYNLHTPSKGFRKENEESDKIDELQLAYKLLGSEADSVRSNFRPSGPMLAQYFKENSNLDNIRDIISKSFKVHLSKNPDKEEKALMKKFENYTQVLLKQGFLMRDYKNQITLTPKGEILAMSQGMNPLMLSSLAYDEKFKSVTPTQLCQIAAHIAGSDEQEEGEDFESLVGNKIRFVSKKVGEEFLNQTEYEIAKSIVKNREEKLLKALKESRVHHNDIKITDPFSGLVGYLFASLNKIEPNSVANFEAILSTVDNMASSDILLNREYDRHCTEGNVYKIITGSITVLKQLIRICDFALSDELNYPNIGYWEHLKENAQKAIELLDREPINNNPEYENKPSNK